MQMVILAAGKGHRLTWQTGRNRSKAMYPILGKPMIERVIDQFRDYLKSFILVINPNDEEIQRYFSTKSTANADYQFAYQEKPLGTAHALACAEQFIKEDILVSACDNLLSIEFISNLIKDWNQNKCTDILLTLIHSNRNSFDHSAKVTMTGDLVTQIIEKPTSGEYVSNISSLPLYCFKKQIMNHLSNVPLSTRGEYEIQDAITSVINSKGIVRGIFADNRLTLTAIEDLLSINKWYLNRDKTYRNIIIEPGDIGENVQIFEPVYIGKNTFIEKNCCIGPNVYIESHCCIGENTIIENSVLLRRSFVPKNSIIRDKVVL